MSASLVGSEMCIRDSPCAQGLGGLAWPGHRRGPRWHGRGDGEVAGRAPVSYTHLTLPTICSV
eukprot:5437457-Alexandrium_andersonii.AAC.1